MERLELMKETLMGQVQAQLGDIKNADAAELGAAIDMIKDLAEAMYYCTVTEAMEEKEEKAERAPETHHYYTERMVYPPMDFNRMYYYDGDGRRGYHEYEPIHYGKMYYGDGTTSHNQNYGNGSNGRSYYSDGTDYNYNGGNGSGSSSNYGGSRNYTEAYPMMVRDRREGNSPQRRRMYMESKEMHQGKEKQIKELENYMNELANDLTEMIQGASPEEKQIMQQKISGLATKIK